MTVDAEVAPLFAIGHEDLNHGHETIVVYSDLEHPLKDSDVSTVLSLTGVDLNNQRSNT